MCTLQHCNTAALQECGANISKRRCRERKKKTTTATTKKKGSAARRLAPLRPEVSGHGCSATCVRPFEFNRRVYCSPSFSLSHGFPLQRVSGFNVRPVRLRRKHGLVIILTCGADSLAPPLSASSTAHLGPRSFVWNCQKAKTLGM